MAKPQGKKCPDCRQCRQCAPVRCRQCLKCTPSSKGAELGPFLTYGEYLAWKRRKRAMKKTVVVDPSRCTGCDSCIEVCPAVFRRNEAMGYVEAADLVDYPEEEVRQAVTICPADSIRWEESGEGESDDL